MRVFMTFTGMLARMMAAAAVVVVVGCAPTREPESSPEPTALFYPPPPALARIQHLATLSAERDLGPRPSGFATFVLGDETDGKALRQPYGVAYHAGKLYVADAKLRGLAVFDLVAERMGVVTGSGAGRMRKPINVTIAEDGTKYVTDTGRDQVLVLGPDDRFVTAFGDEGQFKPVDVAVTAQRLYVTDVAHHRVAVLDRASGREVGSFGKAGSGPGSCSTRRTSHSAPRAMST